MMSADDKATGGDAAGARAGRTALAAFGALALATGAELWLAVGASGDRATRVTALAGLLTAKGGIVLSLDPRVGDFEKADVLIDGKLIAQIAPSISVADALVELNRLGAK